MPWSLFAALLSFTPSAVGSPLPWQLRYVNLHVAIDPALRRIDGAAFLSVSAAQRVSALVLDLSDSLTVDSSRIVEPATSAVNGTREPGHLRFAIASQPGRLYLVAIWYHGQPARRAIGFGGQPSRDRVASYGLPHSAREWWPGIDDPAQKADSADIWITAPLSLVAVSNGRLIARSVNPGSTNGTTHWAVRHPIYPDVISFAIGDYAVTRSTISLLRRLRTPLEFYLFPEDSAKGAADFTPVPAILAFLSERLGPYPFADEKYALVEFARHSFREGQTLSHLGANLITGTHDAEQVIAHEIAHQWFGNSLTVRTWEDIWLNESLSEYMAWQWIRKMHGDSAYNALLDSAVIADAPAAIVPANPADFNTLFGNATFQRGPAVLVMLERQIGVRAFEACLKKYVARYAYGTVETADLQRACEAASGRSLEAFFARWVRGTSKLPKLT